MPNTWKLFSKEVLGYEAPLTKINGLYVSVNKVQDWLDRGKTKEQIFLAWNAGEQAKKCGKGTNKFGVKYDSCSYVKKGLIAYNNL